MSGRCYKVHEDQANQITRVTEIFTTLLKQIRQARPLSLTTQLIIEVKRCPWDWKEQLHDSA